MWRFQQSEIQIDTIPDRQDYQAILIGVQWAYGCGVIVIPIPKGCLEEAGYVVDNLRLERCERHEEETARPG